MILEFKNHIKSLQEKYFKQAYVEVAEEWEFYLKLKVIIDKNYFISIRCNERSKRFDFALIKYGKRIVGFDNLGGWHTHPLENPESHKECSAPTLEEVFSYFAMIVAKKSSPARKSKKKF